MSEVQAARQYSDGRVSHGHRAGVVWPPGAASPISVPGVAAGREAQGWGRRGRRGRCPGPGWL